MSRSRLLALALWAALAASASAAPNDWAEGAPKKDDGATRDFYNRAGQLEWKNKMGDWRDAKDKPQGDAPYASASVRAADKGKFVEWDVTALVGEWLAGTHPNQGFFLRLVEGKGAFEFVSREDKTPADRPQLVLTADKTVTLTPQADTYLDASTYRSLGNGDRLRLSANNPVLIRFDLGKAARPTKAMLRLHVASATSGAEAKVGVFRCRQGHDDDDKPQLGLAAKYPGDKGIDKDADVFFATGFEAAQWQKEWSQVGSPKWAQTVEADKERKFVALSGKALRAHLAEGELTALNTLYKFRPMTGKEPEEAYFRYYLRLGDDWNQTIQGGKFPGFSGTYGKAGWGGRKVDGTDGWSARGAFGQIIPEGNPLAGLHPIGTYCYHADMTGNYGDVWLWTRGYRGFLQKNRWYCVEQYVKLNEPGKKDGVLRAWIDGRLAFEKTGLRYRTVDRLKIEQVWMNVYHGGTRPSPHDQHLYIDNVVIARKYVGPIK